MPEAVSISALLKTMPEVFAGCRNQTSADAISYPVKGLNTDDWGTWPVQYRAVPCPVNQHNMAFAFLNASSPVCPPFPAPMAFSRDACEEKLFKPMHDHAARL